MPTLFQALHRLQSLTWPWPWPQVGRALAGSPFPQGSSGLCWMLVPVGEGKKSSSCIPAAAPEVVKCHPTGQEHRKKKRLFPSLLPPPALFQGLDLSSLSLHTGCCTGFGHKSLRVAAPDTNCPKHSVCAFACVVSFRGTDMMCLFPHNYQSWMCAGK